MIFPRLVMFACFADSGDPPASKETPPTNRAARTAAAMRASALPIEVWTTGADHAAFAAWLGDDLNYVDQREGDLGDRLARAAESAPVIIVGADCADVNAAQLLRAAAALEESSVVIGPAGDGDYWLLGLATPLPFLFEDMPWGTDGVLRETLDRLAARGFAPFMLDARCERGLSDNLDRWTDLPRWRDGSDALGQAHPPL